MGIVNPTGAAGAQTGVGGASMNVKGPSITITEYAIPTPSSPGWICAGGDGKIWFTHQSTAPSAIGNLTTMGTMFNLFKTSTTNTGPMGIAGGPDGNVWYTKQGGIGRAQPSGMVDEYGVPNGGDSGSITAGPDGNLWFTEPIHDRIGRITPQAAFTQYNLPTTGGHPWGITAGPDGNLWFTETSGNRIGRVTPTGTVMEFPIPTAGAYATSIAKGPDGNLWFTEHDAHQIARITPAGVVTEFPVGSGGDPGSIIAGADGNLWFTEAGGANAVGRVTPMGGVSEYAVPTAAADPTGIAAGPDKNLWFTELSTNKIGRLSDLAGGGALASSDVTATVPLSGNMMCMKDSDCVASGKACGGDVCSYASATHVCVLAVSGDPGWCAADADCWCKGQGATCSATTHHCSSTM
jgi:streptogramin lyase